MFEVRAIVGHNTLTRLLNLLLENDNGGFSVRPEENGAARSVPITKGDAFAQKELYKTRV